MFTILSGCKEEQKPVADEKVPVIVHDYTAVRQRIDSIAKTIQGRIGVAAINLSTGDNFSYNGHQHFPMFSTYKFPLALYVLKQVENGKLSLTQEVTISKDEIKSYSHGKFVETHEGDVIVTVDSMIYYAMAYSDNITTDNLFKLAGGAGAVNEYVHQKGIVEIAIVNTVKEMGQGGLYKNNSCAPMAMTRLLELFHKGKMLGKEQQAYLLKYMETAPSGPKRIKGLLPEGTVVAHKTGTGGTINGRTEGVNDIGIITLPNGEHLALSVFVTDIAADIPVAEAILAKIAKVVYDDVVGQQGQ
jgi:beta-lactamase class A